MLNDWQMHQTAPRIQILQQLMNEIKGLIDEKLKVNQTKLII